MTTPTGVTVAPSDARDAALIDAPEACDPFRTILPGVPEGVPPFGGEMALFIDQSWTDWELTSSAAALTSSSMLKGFEITSSCIGRQLFRLINHLRSIHGKLGN
jgi:hypothetical protein